MSVSDTTSSLSMNDILANSSKKTSSTTGGIASATNSATGGQALGKDAFLQLLVTQLKNQNPLDPQDNSAFVAQLAQFSSLEGITTLNTSVNNISGSFKSSQALQASSLVGRSVVVQTGSAYVDTTKSMTGSVVVPTSVASSTVTVTDKDGKPLTFASVGPGSFYHLLGEHLSKVTGIPMIHVPYKGAAPAEQDLMAGQVDFFLAPYGKKYDEMQKQGRVKVLAMLNSERLESVKQYPAVSESKQLKDFTFKIWTGYFVKKDTPEPVVTALHKAITGTLGDPAVHAALEANSQLLPKPQTLAEADKAYTDGTQQFRAIVKSIGLQAQ